MNLYEKIQAVSIDIKNIEKNMIVGTGAYSYKAVSDLDVTISIKRAEEKFKLISIPIKQDLISSETIKTIKKDGTEGITFVDNIKMTLRIVDLEDTKQFIDIESYGKGVDSGDKGFGKASTYARKYALLNAYKIATGEDPDALKNEEISIKQQPKNEPTEWINLFTKDGEKTKKYFEIENSIKNGAKITLENIKRKYKVSDEVKSHLKDHFKIE